MLTQPGYHPIYFSGNWGITPLEIYLTALASRIAGEQMLTIRYVSAVAGIVTIPALYLLARTLFPMPSRHRLNANQDWGGSTTARRFLPFAACLVLAVLPWHNAFSREGVEVILVPLWTTLAVLFLWGGLESRKWWPFAVSGLFWGSAFYTYRAAWVFPGVLGLFLVFKLFQERGFLRRYGSKLLLLVFIAACGSTAGDIRLSIPKSYRWPRRLGQRCGPGQRNPGSCRGRVGEYRQGSRRFRGRGHSP